MTWPKELIFQTPNKYYIPDDLVEKDTMGFIGEFREFAMKGNVLDMAVGIIIGAAFGSIITSLVKDIIMPPLGLILGNVNFTDLFISLDGKSYASLAVAQAAGAPTINYGLFINTIINFIIVALAIFIVIRRVNEMKRKPEPAKPNTKECPFCKESIPKNAVKCSHCTSDLGLGQ
ncbi:Large-conductance mechanosensitive channel [uncultured archaeon]|nr:Large-conductance mechanosensitive channel [uncultured archaeon]